jgi:hypothetical protein
MAPLNRKDLPSYIISNADSRVVGVATFVEVRLGVKRKQNLIPKREVVPLCPN